MPPHGFALLTGEGNSPYGRLERGRVILAREATVAFGRFLYSLRERRGLSLGDVEGPHVGHPGGEAGSLEPLPTPLDEFDLTPAAIRTVIEVSVVSGIR